jgi:hypothetical protein
MRYKIEIKVRLEKYAEEKNDWWEIIRKAPDGSKEKEAAWIARDLLLARIQELEWILNQKG